MSKKENLKEVLRKLVKEEIAKFEKVTKSTPNIKVTREATKEDKIELNKRDTEAQKDMKEISDADWKKLRVAQETKSISEEEWNDHRIKVVEDYDKSIEKINKMCTEIGDKTLHSLVLDCHEIHSGLKTGVPHNKFTMFTDAVSSAIKRAYSLKRFVKEGKDQKKYEGIIAELAKYLKRPEAKENKEDKK
jgi:hypothetical protein